MKTIHTLRGVVNANTKKIIFENDLGNVGWKVIRFEYWPNDMDTNPYVAGKLWKGSDDGGSLQYSDAGDNRAFAWAACSGVTAESVRYSIIDPDHIINSDLRVINMGSSSASYLVVLERMALSDDQAIMTLIKERSQDDI